MRQLWMPRWVQLNTIVINSVVFCAGYDSNFSIMSAVMNPIEGLLKSLFVMSSLVEARDPYTGGHLWRVARFSQLVAEELHLSREDVARIALGGFIHDLGKIGVPDAILNKPDRLSDDEYDVIKTHPEVGARVLSGHPLAKLAMAAVFSHHETPDGKGYPRGLSGEDVPLDARIVGVTDAFDAMTSTRPYRSGMPVAKALDIIEENLGRQFDSVAGNALIRLGRQGALAHIVGHTDMGIPLQECPECGPTIVVRRDQQDGDYVYCRKCTYKTTVIRDAEGLRLADSELYGTAAEMQPIVDMALIDDLVGQARATLR